MRRTLLIVALAAWCSTALADDEADFGAMVDGLPDGAARPVARQIEDEIKLDPLDIQRTLSELIAERDNIVRRHDLFRRLKAAQQLEAPLKGLRARVNAASVALGRANHQLQAAQERMKGVAANPAAVDAADAVRARAEAALVDATQGLQAQLQQLEPIYADVREDLPAFLTNYQRMRALLLPDRRNPHLGAFTSVLESGNARTSDFVEGHVLSAIALTYAGEADRAERSLEKASAFVLEHNLVLTALGEDCCYGWLLIGKPQSTKPYIDHLKKLDVPRQTPARCWLIAAWSAASGKHADAISFFGKAVAKSKGNAPPQLLAEAAMALTYLEGKTNAEKAGRYLEEAGDNGSWQLLRARAGLAAENEKWSEAIELLEECILAAPPRLEAELRVQQASYREEEPWRIVVPKKGAAKPARRP